MLRFCCTAVSVPSNSQYFEKVVPNTNDVEYASYLKKHEDYKLISELAVLNAISQGDVKSFVKEIGLDDDRKRTKRLILNSIRNLRPDTPLGRKKIILKNSLRSFSFQIYACFLLGSAIGITANILGRSEHYLAWLHELNLPAVSSWLYTIGLVRCVRSSCKEKVCDYELYRGGKKLILSWVGKFTPSEMERYYDKWSLTKNDHNLSEGNATSGGLTICDVKRILDTDSVYIPPHILRQLFDEIDVDRNERITYNEMRTYYETEVQKKDFLVKSRAVMKNTVLSWDFWSNVTWCLGSVAYVACAHGTNTWAKEILSKTGAFLYILGAALMFPIAINDAISHVNYREELHRELSTHKFGDDVDKPMNDDEMFGALLKADIPIPLKVFRNIHVETVRTVNEGKVSVREFFNSLQRFLHSGEHRRRRFLTVSRKLVTTTSFWMSVLYSVAGVLFMVGSFAKELGLNNVQTANVMFSGSFLYAAAGVYNIAAIPRSLAAQRSTFDDNKMRFRDNLLKGM